MFKFTPPPAGARGSREDIIDVLRRSGARTGISIMLQVGGGVWTLIACLLCYLKVAWRCHRNML